MEIAVSGLFNRFVLAEDALGELGRAGFERDRMSIVSTAKAAPAPEEGWSMHGVETGAAVGGVAGLALGLAALAIPGAGPLIAAGPLAIALGATGIGVAGGGLLGAFTASGIPEDDAGYYAEGVRQGGAVAMVKTDPERAEHARDILERAGAVRTCLQPAG